MPIVQNLTRNKDILQCDQMAQWRLQYLAVYKNEKLPQMIKKLSR